MIDLSKFCGEAGHGKYDLSTPWACRGWLYASDGALMVRVLTDLPDEEPVPIKRPEKAPKFFEPPINATRPWPGVEAEVPGTKACYKCEEDADDEWDSEDETTHCDICGGDGIVADMDKMLNGFRFRGKYCRLIETLPNVKYEKGRVIDNSVRFTFDGGEGVCMKQDDGAARDIRHQFDEKMAARTKVPT